MNIETESQIESCLAYHVLQNAEKWIEAPRTSYLAAFLTGAKMRAIQTDTSFSAWKIHVVLEYPEFYSPLVASTGNPKLTIKWDTAIEMTHLSFAEGYSELLNQALGWHREYGIKKDISLVFTGTKSTSSQSIEEFWNHFVTRPTIYFPVQDGIYSAFLTVLQRVEIGWDYLKLLLTQRFLI